MKIIQNIFILLVSFIGGFSQNPIHAAVLKSGCRIFSSPLSYNVNNIVKNKKPDYKLKPDQKVSEKMKLQVLLVDSETNQPVNGKVVVKDVKGLINQGPTIAGKYSAEIRKDIKITIRAESDGYMPIVSSVDAAHVENGIILKLSKIKQGASLVMENIKFERGKFELLPESFTELDKLVDLMNKYPKMEIELAGHTDNVGDPQKNIELSENRIKEVKAYLVKKGLKASRITGVGYGGSKPIASNANEETRKLNRRVEFKILKLE